MANCHPACRPVANIQFNVLHITIEKDGPSRHQAKLQVALKVPYTKEVHVNGPPRDSRVEAVKDGLTLGQMFMNEGEAGCKTVALRLKKKKWTSKELDGVDETQLSGFVLPGMTSTTPMQSVQQKLVPPGEGWQRHNDDMLVHPQSQVFFVQLGEQAGQYLLRSSEGNDLEQVAPPHTPEEKPVLARAASASVVRGTRGKLDRAVLLNDIGKIARLALKMPLSFVDRPASAYALFQGFRSAEAAQWCAENFHKKLLPLLAAKIHEHSTEELMDIARQVLRELDAELLASALHPHSGCCALLALLLGDRVVLAGIGHVRAVLLPDSTAGARGAPKTLLVCRGDPEVPAEKARLREAGGAVESGLVCRQAAETADDASRILGARHAFDVLGLDMDGPFDEKEVRSLYRKLALRVHPDKAAEGADAVAYKQAFARLESAKAALETMLSEDQESCKQLCRVLRSEVYTRGGAASLLGFSPNSSPESEDVDKASKEVLEKLAKVQHVARDDYEKAKAVCDEASEIMKRSWTPEGLPRLEVLTKEGVPSSRAMGVRDLRRPWPVVTMEPEATSWKVPPGSISRLVLLCGATAKLNDAQLSASTKGHAKRPKVSALRWCQDADPEAECSSCICINLGVAGEQEAKPAGQPPAKKLKGATDGAVRLRHIMFRHPQLRQGDPMARREGACKSAQEAEEAALNALERLMKNQSQFPQLCRELSDCQTAETPGALSGDLGWVSKGPQLEPAVEEAAFALKPNELSDVVVSSRGVHVFQRLA